MNWFLTASLSYWTVGLGTIVWTMFSVSKVGPEPGVGMALFLSVLGFPSSVIVFGIYSLISPFLHPIGESIFVGYCVGFVAVLAGYLQWFYFFPWIIQKIKSLL